MQWIFEYMNIPDSCKVGNTIFKKLFYENVSMSSKDKDLFKDCVEKIVWEYSIKPETLNIPIYKDETREYDEIAIITVEINDKTKSNKIAEIIQKTIPYPIVLVLGHEDNVMLNVTHKSTNQVDSSRNTLDELLYTDWISKGEFAEIDDHFVKRLDVREYSFVNLYNFYNDISVLVQLQIASQFKENILSRKNIDVIQTKEITNKIIMLERKIHALRNDLKKEKHFNRKMKINIDIKQVEKKISEYKMKL